MQKFIANNHVILSAIIASLITTLTSFVHTSPVNLPAISLAALTGVLGVIGNQWKGSALSTTSAVGSLSYATYQMLSGHTFTWETFWFTAIINVLAFGSSGLDAVGTKRVSAAAKALVILIGFLAIGHVTRAQEMYQIKYPKVFSTHHHYRATPFFSRIPRIPYGSSVVETLTPGKMEAVVTATDSIYMALRPITIPLAYGFPGNNEMSGLGVAYQKLDYNYASQLNTMIWEVGAAAFGGINEPAPATVNAIATLGAFFGITIPGFPAPVLGGPDYYLNAPKGQHWGGFVSISINLNN